MKKYLAMIPFMITSLSTICVHANSDLPEEKWQSQSHQQQVMKGDYAPVPANVSAGPYLQDGCDVYVGAEMLYWYSNLSDSAIYVSRIKTLIDSETSPGATRNFVKKVTDMDWAWDFGSRVYLGCVFDHDGWNLESNWTYFYNKSSISKSVPPLFVPFSSAPLGAKDLGSKFSENPGNGFSKISAAYRLQFNQIDLQLGRHFWLSKCLALKYFYGIRGVWTKTRLSFDQQRILEENTSNSNTNNFEKNWNEVSNWGVGIFGGLRSNWYFASDWSLYAEAKAALPYGKSNLKIKRNRLDLQQDDVVSQNYDSSYFHEVYAALPMLDLATGLQWDSYLCCRRFHLAFIAGWEAHWLVDFNRFDKNWETGSGDFIWESIGSLFMSGFNVQARFQF